MRKRRRRTFTAVPVIDASTFPETGADSCGVARQWCGRLGKQENCQRGRRAGARAGGPGGRCHTAGWTPGRRGSHGAAGPG